MQLLFFYACSELPDLGLETLAKSLKGLVRLQSLTLCFDACKRITDKGLQNLDETRDKLPCLQKTDFSPPLFPYW